MPGASDSGGRPHKRTLLYAVALALSFSVLAVAAALAWDQMNEVIDNVQRRNYVGQLDRLKNNQQKLVNSLDQIAKVHSRALRNRHGGSFCGPAILFPGESIRTLATPAPGTSAALVDRTPFFFSTLADTDCNSRLRLLKKLSVSLAASVYSLWDYPEISHYTFNTEHTFFAQTGMPTPAMPSAMHAEISAATEHLLPGLRHWSESGQPASTPFVAGLHRMRPETQQVFSIAAPIYGAANQLLAITAIDIERDAFDKILLRSDRLPGFFVFDISGGAPLLLSNSVADERPILLSIYKHWRFLVAGTNDLSVVEVGSHFFFVEAIAGTPWVAVYGFNFSDILLASESLWMWISFSMFGSLLMLWGGIYLVNRYVLMPLSQASQRIVASEQLNRTIIATAPVGLCMLDLQTMQPLLANDLASTYAQRWGQRPDLARSILTAYRSILQQHGHSRSDESVLYTELPSPEKIDAPPLLAAFSHVWYQGREVLLCGLSDITIHKEAEAMLQQARQSADEANEAKSMFLATISHEIRTPLHGAMGNLELLGKTRLTAAQRSTVGTINRSFSSLLQIINNVLDLSKAGAGQLHLGSDAFNFPDLLEDVARTFAPCVVKNDVQFLFLLDSLLPPNLHGDEARLRQMFNNLLSNAVKFTSGGSIIMRANLVATTPAGCTFSVEIADTGIGISNHDQDKLFVPFQQANKTIAATFGGTGLGLSLVKNLCDAMDGTIKINSRQGQGTSIVVTLTLPIAACQTNVHHGDTSVPAPVLQAVTIALHCDDSAWRQQLRTLLRSHGANVRDWYEPGTEREHNGASDTVLIACQDGEQAAQLARLAMLSDTTQARHVLLTPLGPLQPERHDGKILVSALSRKGLLLAVDPAFTAPAEAHYADINRDDEPVYPGHFETNRLQPAQQQCAPPSARPDPNEPYAAPLSILLVEDDMVNVTLAQQQLALLGYTHIERAGNGREALEKCMRKSYQLILTDQFMPEMDGNRFAASLRQQAYPATIIMITASRPSPANCKNIDGLLLKPVSLEQLRSALTCYTLPEQKCLPSRETKVPGAKEGETKVPETKVLDTGSHNKILWDAFLQDYAETMTTLEAGIRANDSAKCRQQLHKLKGALKILREPLAEQVEAFEQAGKMIAFIDLGDAFHSLQQALRLLVAIAESK